MLLLFPQSYTQSCTISIKNTENPRGGWDSLYFFQMFSGSLNLLVKFPQNRKSQIFFQSAYMYLPIKVKFCFLGQNWIGFINLELMLKEKDQDAVAGKNQWAGRDITHRSKHI